MCTWVSMSPGSTVHPLKSYVLGRDAFAPAGDKAAIAPSTTDDNVLVFGDALPRPSIDAVSAAQNDIGSCAATAARRREVQRPTCDGAVF